MKKTQTEASKAWERRQSSEVRTAAEEIAKLCDLLATLAVLAVKKSGL